MKSRLAILAMLVTGMLFSTAGVGLALQGGGTNASLAQYAECTPTPTPPVGTVSPTDTGSTQQGGANGNVCEEGGVLPAEESSPGGEESPATEEGGVLPAEENDTPTQPERQQAAAAETSQLPFTGFAAIPVLLGGLALLTGGLILRRRTSHN